MQIKLSRKLLLAYVVLLAFFLWSADYYAQWELQRLRWAAPGEETAVLRALIRRAVLAVAAVLSVLSGCLFLVYARRFSRRIEEMKIFCQRMARGDFQPLPAEDREEPLAGLAGALREASLQHDHAIRMLTEERNRSETILRSMVDGVAVIGADERNRSESLSGFTAWMPPVPARWAGLAWVFPSPSTSLRPTKVILR